MSVTMRYVTFISIFALFVVKITCAEYNVHWLSEQITIDRAMPYSKQPVDIYCYRGSTKSILSLWHTVKFHIKIKDNEFGQYIGTSPQEVFKDYTEDSYGWSVNPFQRRASTSVSLDLFNSTCMAINTKQRHSIQLQINRIDIWRILTLFLGMSLIFLSRPLSGNPVFFYLCGILVGVCASFMVVVYYVSKLLPRKPVMYGMLIGGWTVGVYIFQQIWQNIKSILLTYQMHLFWYTLIAGFISFVVCYRIGPPQNKRSQNLVMWTLQGVGMLLIFFSSQYQEASAALMVITMIIKYFPESFIHSCRSYWHRRFPPKRRLLSNEEYYEQGARETKHALDSLREYCASPDCAQWRIMMKLNDSKRFASFVEGDSHLSDDEILDYEAYAFSADRQPKRQSRAAYNTRASASASHLEISDDDSTDTDNEI